MLICAKVNKKTALFPKEACMRIWVLVLILKSFLFILGLEKDFLKVETASKTEKYRIPKSEQAMMAKAFLTGGFSTL